MAVGRQYGHTEEDFDIVDTDKSGYLDAQEIQDFFGVEIIPNPNLNMSLNRSVSREDLSVSYSQEEADQDYGHSVSELGVKMEMNDNEVTIEMQNDETKSDRQYPLTVG